MITSLVEIWIFLTNKKETAGQTRETQDIVHVTENELFYFTCDGNTVRLFARGNYQIVGRMSRRYVKLGNPENPFWEKSEKSFSSQHRWAVKMLSRLCIVGNTSIMLSVKIRNALLDWMKNRKIVAEKRRFLLDDIQKPRTKLTLILSFYQ